MTLTEAEIARYHEQGYLVPSYRLPPAVLEGVAHPGHPKDSEKHIFAASKSPLETISDGLPQYEGYAPADVSPTA